jgi:hypothetical protein
MVKRKQEPTETGSMLGDAKIPAPPIREQILQMSPMTDDDLKHPPEDTDLDVEIQPRKLKKDGTPRKRRTMAPESASDNLMDDPRYVKAIQGLNFFGAPRMLKRGFKTGATILKDPEIALSQEEEENVDNYFYALSKHMNFDPMATIIGRAILLILLLGELIVWRWLKYSPYGEIIKKWLSEQVPEKPKHDKSTVM